MRGVIYFFLVVLCVLNITTGCEKVDTVEPNAIESTSNIQMQTEVEAQTNVDAQTTLSSEKQLESEAQNESESESISESESESESESTSEFESEEVLTTPYQFLNLSVGNADEINFTYTVTDYETKTETTGAFYKNTEKSMEIFSAWDETGAALTVRELEYNGDVYFIIDEDQTVKRYPGTANDFLLYKMMLATWSQPIESEKDGCHFYEYSVPFEQDPQIVFTYGFYMKDGILIKLDYSVDGFLAKTFEFSAFLQEVDDQTLFDYPDDYTIETMNYPYSEEQLPPWWENDGL